MTPSSSSDLLQFASASQTSGIEAAFNKFRVTSPSDSSGATTEASVPMIALMVRIILNISQANMLTNTTAPSHQDTSNIIRPRIRSVLLSNCHPIRRYAPPEEWDPKGAYGNILVSVSAATGSPVKIYQAGGGQGRYGTGLSDG
ncbi:hypothetical protein V1527DRAFT_491648 [Lipomyces starkeyi]